MARNPKLESQQLETLFEESLGAAQIQNQIPPSTGIQTQGVHRRSVTELPLEAGRSGDDQGLVSPAEHGHCSGEEEEVTSIQEVEPSIQSAGALGSGRHVTSSINSRCHRRRKQSGQKKKAVCE